MGCHFLFQGIFQTQGSNSCLLHWQADSLTESGKPVSWYILNKLGMKVSFLNLINSIYEKPTADITLSDERLKAFTFKEENLTCIVCAVCSVIQSRPTLCNLMDCSHPSSSVHGISQAKIREQVAMPFSTGSSEPRDQTHVSCIGRQVLYHWAIREDPILSTFYNKFPKPTFKENQNTFKNPFLERKGMLGNKISAILKDNQSNLAQH